MTITCPKCGKSVSSDYQFCPYCGGSLATGGGFNNGNNGGFGGQTNQGNTGFPPPPSFDQNGNPRTQQQQQQGQQGSWPFPNLNPGGNTGTGGNILRNNAGCLAIIGSFIIPLIGVVLYFVYRRKNNMQAAKKVLYAAIAGVAFNLLINVVGHGSQYSYFHNLMGN
ncbi:MAG: zinc ribbon domain-containing protein [Bacteroidales bacterium]|nr:zinc ribbon domain-containing protein [Bacteroidales bacterium]MBR5670549.1 zinc ribbon domain-containing protein [Bacteroidales bacterium]